MNRETEDTTMSSKAIPVTAVLCSLILAWALHSGLTSLRGMIGPSGNVGEADRFHLHDSAHATYVIDQKTGKTWLFTADGPKVIFEPSASGQGWAVIEENYPKAKPADYGVLAPNTR